MWHKRSNKLVLLAAMTAFLGGVEYFPLWQRTVLPCPQGRRYP